METRELLRQGWNVLAIDAQPSAVELLQTRVEPSHIHRLDIRIGSVADMELPSADFIWAGLSLPFVNPQVFPVVWSAIVKALKPGGRFAGDFFGVRDEWRNEADMTFHTSKNLRELFRPLRLEYFMSELGLRPTATLGLKQSHAFAAIVSRHESSSPTLPGSKGQ